MMNEVVLCVPVMMFQGDVQFGNFLTAAWSLVLISVSFVWSQHKKLAEGSAYEEVSTSTPYSENDISNSIKNGILYLEDPINHVNTFKLSFFSCSCTSSMMQCFERLLSSSVQHMNLLNISSKLSPCLLPVPLTGVVPSLLCPDQQ